MLNEWLKLNEHIWLFWQLNLEILLGSLTFVYILKEFYYDKQKDDQRKQRKTRTTKKTTTSASGQSTVEESTEVVEPIETLTKEESK
jgi:hypothetical protein